jgi:hypothetical protein
MESIVSQEHYEITDKNVASSMYTLASAFSHQQSAISYNPQLLLAFVVFGLNADG